MVHVRKEDVARGANVPATRGQLAFVYLRFMIKGYISEMRNVDLQIDSKVLF